MSTEITHAMINNAKAAVSTYSANVKAQYDALEAEINKLRTTNFRGDASDGYQVFFNQKVTPALTENIESIAKTLENILEGVKVQLLDGLDPQMGQENQNPGT